MASLGSSSLSIAVSRAVTFLKYAPIELPPPDATLPPSPNYCTH